MTRYLILPLTTYLDFKTNLEEATTEAKELTNKYGFEAGVGFCVIEAKFVGQFEVVTPIWNDLDPVTKAENKEDNEVPF